MNDCLVRLINEGHLPKKSIEYARYDATYKLSTGMKVHAEDIEWNQFKLNFCLLGNSFLDACVWAQ